MASGNRGKPPIDEARARELLERERERIEAELAGLERGRKQEIAAIQDESSAEGDAGLIENETVDEALTHSLKQKLEAIERAEKRLEKGTYGFSIESGEPIPAKRLEAVPWAERTKDEQEP